jgi:hypothetical protein
VTAVAGTRISKSNTSVKVLSRFREETARRRWLYLTIFVALFLHRGYLSSGVLVAGDSLWISPQALHEYFRLPTAWDPTGGLGASGLGFANFNLNVEPLNILLGALHRLGLGFGLIQRIVIFLPAALLPYLSMYWFANRFAKHSLAKFVSAVVYGANTYFVTIGTQHLYLVLASGIAPLVWGKALDSISSVTDAGTWSKRSISNFVQLGILASVVLAIDARIALLTLIIAVGLGMGEIRRREQRSAAVIVSAVSGSIFIGLQLYWLLPAILGGGKSTYGSVVPESSLPSAIDFAHSLALNHPYANGGTPVWFQTHPVMPVLFLLPVLAFLGLLAATKQQKTLATVFALFACLGVWMAKGNAAPFGSSYDWMYAHVPGMSLFRDSSKFFGWTAAAYAVLIGVLADRVIAACQAPNKDAYHVSLLRGASVARTIRLDRIAMLVGGSCLALVMLYGARAAFFNDLGWASNSVQVPNDDLAFSKFLAADHTFGRVLWLPLSSSFDAPTAEHPVVVPANLQTLSTGWSGNQLALGQIMQQSPVLLSPETLRLAGIRYVAVIDDPQSYFWTELNFNPSVVKSMLGSYESELTTAGYQSFHLRPALDVFMVPNATSLFAVQSTPMYQSTLNGYSVPYQRQHQNSYMVQEGTSLAYLRMNQSYNPGWHMKVTGSSASGQIAVKTEHVRASDGTNLWHIDEPAGVTNLKFNIAYQPQKIANVGTLLSGAILVVALFVLIVTRSRPRDAGYGKLLSQS